ncbi:hypothetical protein [Allokutzneria sp. NRRL B-24872]|uniref:hypothetical protein n=1 Tax=Allokutzneria sp. NRRL B-24872 TaxID=1137961 RepID=UPI000A385ED8|nr:hypothetical protein [Allokutzneria sp. NRRL B-24872]
MTRILNAALCVALASATVSALSAPAAFAACAESGQVSYSVSGAATSWLPTDLRSDYLEGPGEIIFDARADVRANASLAGVPKAEAERIFTSARTSLRATVVLAHAHAARWTHSAKVPAGQIRRVQQYVEARTFTVRKTSVTPSCTVKTAWTKKITAPLKSGSYQWRLVA